MGVSNFNSIFIIGQIFGFYPHLEVFIHSFYLFIHIFGQKSSFTLFSRFWYSD
jgi:hypothetical protein